MSAFAFPALGIGETGAIEVGMVEPCSIEGMLAPGGNELDIAGDPTDGATGNSET
jgi:hypothetical protein